MSTTSNPLRSALRSMAVAAVGVAVLAGCNTPLRSSELDPLGPGESTIGTSVTNKQPGRGSRVDPSGSGGRSSNRRDAQGSFTLRDAAEEVESTIGDRLARELVAPTNSGDSVADLATFMEYVLQDAANVWTWYYEQWNAQAPGEYPTASGVKWVFLDEGEEVRAACKNRKGSPAVANEKSAFYCSADDTIYFGFTAARSMWSGSFTGPMKVRAPGGDYALAAALVHEYGHNVQAEMNVKNAGLDGPSYEQMADCLAGSFTRVAAYQGILEAGDLEEGWRIMRAVGDDGTGIDAHGSPDERGDAFLTGWKSQSPAGCWRLVGLS